MEARFRGADGVRSADLRKSGGGHGHLVSADGVVASAAGATGIAALDGEVGSGGGLAARQPEIAGDRILRAGQQDAVEENGGATRASGARRGQQAMRPRICGGGGADWRAGAVERTPALDRSVFEVVSRNHLSAQMAGAEQRENENHA